MLGPLLQLSLSQSAILIRVPRGAVSCLFPAVTGDTQVAIAFALDSSGCHWYEIKKLINAANQM